MFLKRLLFTGLITLLATLFIAGCSSSTSTSDNNGQHISLNFATFWPSENFYVTEGHQAWMKQIKSRVESETNHTIEFAMHSGGSLLGATEIYEGVANGAADIGSTCPSYSPGIFRATSAFELPGFHNDNAVVASMAIQEAYETIDIINQEYEGVKVMHFWATGPGDLLTTSPIHSLEDLKGMEIRVAGGSVPAMEALGAAPVTMPMGESYLSLQQGIVKGILGPTEILKGFGLAEVTKHITKTPYLYNIVFVKVMNLDTWNSLPVEVQEIIDDINATSVYDYGELSAKHSTIGEKYAVDQYGLDVVNLSTDEEARWLTALSEVQNKWVLDMTKNGLPAQSVLDKAHELDQKYSSEYGNLFK